MKARIPITLVTGSRASGKTTLLEKMLEEADWRIAVIADEWKEIIRGDPLEAQGKEVQIPELEEHCARCTMEETFEKSVTEIVNETAPESIVIEVAEAKEVESMVRLIEKELSEVFLANVVHIVDASVGLFGSAGDSGARGALERADFVLINKVDLVSLDRVDRVKAQVQEYNEDAVLVQTEQCEIGTDLFGSMVKRRAVPIFHSRDVDFQSFTYMSDRLFEWEKFQQTLADLPFAVYRAKGSVRCAQGGYRFDYVVGRPELERCSAGKTRMVFIGPQLNECRQAILRRVRACEV